MIKLANGYQIPKLGLGTYLMEDDEQTINVINSAIKVGYRHFDTAQMYYNEEPIGEALSKSGLKREEYFITTKLHSHHNPTKTKELIMESLKKLKVDYLDLLLIHWPNHDDEINLQTWKVFEELYEQGILKAIGVSNFTRYQLDKLLSKCKIKPMINQVEMHPLLSQIPLRKYLKENDMRLTSYGPLMRGKMLEEPFKEIFESIALKHNCTIGQVVIKWALNKDIMLIPKTVNENRLIENFNSVNVNLDEEDMLVIDNINTGRRLYADPSNNVYGKFIK